MFLNTPIEYVLCAPFLCYWELSKSPLKKGKKKKHRHSWSSCNFDKTDSEIRLLVTLITSINLKKGWQPKSGLDSWLRIFSVESSSQSVVLILFLTWVVILSLLDILTLKTRKDFVRLKETGPQIGETRSVKKKHLNI